MDSQTLLTFNWTAEGLHTSVCDEVAFQMLWSHEALVALVTLELAQVQMLGAVTLQLAGCCEGPVAALPTQTLMSTKVAALRTLTLMSIKLQPCEHRHS